MAKPVGQENNGSVITIRLDWLKKKTKIEKKLLIKKLEIFRFCYHGAYLLHAISVESFRECIIFISNIQC